MEHYVSIALLVSLVCGSCASVAQESSKKLRTTHELNVDGEVRSYLLYRPQLPEGEKVPLMLVLHGGLGNAEYAESSTRMNEVADAGKFLVAYPDGTGGRMARNARTWNAGECCGPAVKQRTDDVAFIAAMIADITGKQPVDPRRVYASGMSNGAMMVYRLACEIPDKLAAIVAVSGPLMVDECDRARDVAVMHIHGDSDTNVPFEGGMGTTGVTSISFRSIPETMRLITAPRRCSEPETSDMNDSVTRTIYHCADGAPVELLVIKGGGHAWPGGRKRANQTGWTDVIFASQVAWDFARQFTKKQ
jgi:polyhydroxybutyrate depolymerase